MRAPTKDIDFLNFPALAGALCYTILVCKAGPSLPARLWVSSLGGFVPAGKRISDASPAAGHLR